MRFYGSFMRVVALAALIFTAFVAHAAARPNIVIIFMDDMGYADIGAFGAKGYQTPNLDRLAKEGCVYRNFHVAQAVCSASRAALQTGCYPNRVGIHGALGPRATHGINSEEMTLGELARQRGYATAMFGKWHLGHLPQFLPVNNGYDEYFGLPYSNDMWPFHPEYADAPLAKKRQGYPELPMIEGTNVVIPKMEAKDQEQLTTWYTERSVKFIKEHRNKPFLLLLTHNMPHVPLYVSDKFKGKTKRGLFGDVIEEIDWSAGQVMQALKEAGVEKNTWVIFTSDNGPWLSYGDHAGSALPLREGKGTSWEGGTRTPCIMRWPGKIEAGTESKAMMMTIDLFPTIANLIGASLPAHTIDGKDVMPLVLNKRGAKNPHSAYWIYYADNQLQSVISGDGRWKLVLPHKYRSMAGQPGGKGGKPAKYGDGTITSAELYDLFADVSETKDVSAQHPDIVRRLQAQAEEARAELGDSLQKRTGSGVRPAGQAGPGAV
jgi:arylsulfatase